VESEPGGLHRINLPTPGDVVEPTRPAGEVLAPLSG